MHEVIDTVLTYIRGIWRYRWYTLAVAWLVALPGWIFVAQLPDEYQARARVYVDTDSILGPLLQGLTIRTNVEQRVQLMTRTLLSRPNLEKIVRGADLDVQAGTPEQADALMSRLQENIKLGSTRRQNLYSISYVDADPETAKRVVQATLNVMIENTLGETREDTDVAQKFLDEQIAEYEQKLVEAEDRLKEFKRQNQGLMASGQDYFQRLESTQAQLDEARLRLREARQRLRSLRQQLEGEAPVFGLGPRSPIAIGDDKGRAAAAGGHGESRRLAELEARLDDLLLRYTEAHPDVQALRQQIEALRQREEARAQAAPQAVPAVAPEVADLDRNPVYQQLKLAAGEAEAEVASLAVRVQEYESRIAELKRLIDTVPEIEAELTRLNRDYAIHKKNYDALVARRETARISEDVGQTGEGVRFRVVDPPRVSPRPVGPNRLLFDVAVLAAALGLGVAIAFLLSQIRPVIYDGRTLRHLTNRPVFGAVSRIWTPELLMRRRMEVASFVVGFALLLVGFGVAVSVSSGISLARSMFDSLGALL